MAVSMPWASLMCNYGCQCVRGIQNRLVHLGPRSARSLNTGHYGSLLQQLESVKPFIPQKARYTPEHAEGFNCTGCLGLAHIGRFPAELIQYAGHRLFSGIVVAANKHSGLAALKLRIDHADAAHGVERLDEASAFELALEPLHKRLVEVGKELQHAVHWRRVSYRVGGVDDRLPREVRRAGRR